MIEQQARVVRIDGGHAWVSVGGQSGCPACDAGRGCGAGVFGKLLRRRPVELALPNSIEASAGQAVTLGLPETLFMRLVLRLYAWPLIGGLAGALISHQIGEWYEMGRAGVDALTLAGLLAGAALAIGLARRGGTSLEPDDIRLLEAGPGAGCLSAGQEHPVPADQAGQVPGPVNSDLNDE